MKMKGYPVILAGIGQVRNALIDVLDNVAVNLGILPEE
jgi:hypothetical protein